MLSVFMSQCLIQFPVQKTGEIAIDYKTEVLIQDPLKEKQATGV